MIRRGLRVVVCVGLLTVGVAPYAAHASFPGTNGLIAYVSIAQNNCPDVHTVAADGTGGRQLTNCPAEVADPAWNPAGNRIAVAMTTQSGSSGPAPLDLYTVGASGAGLTRVTNDTVEDADPYWSPNGSTLVEGRVRDGGLTTQNIATVPASGGTPTTLVTGAPGNEAGDPQYSPDGTRIAFEQRNGPNDDLYVMNADGSGKVDVTTGTDNSNEDYPSWSPDGHYLAFASDRDGVNEIFVIDISGGANNGQVSRITQETSSDDIQPTWSPDQTMIAYTHGCADAGCQGPNGFENGDIDVVTVTDLAHPSTPRAVVATSLPEFEPDWGVPCAGSCAPPSPTGVKRNLTLALSGTLKASGALADPTGKHPECAIHQIVKVQRRSSGSWHTLTSVRTNTNGGYSATISNRSGTYRALAPASTVSSANLACLQVASPTGTRTLNHARTIPHFNLAAKPDGSAMFANGDLKAKDRFDACAAHRRVRIQKRSGTSWVTIATAKSITANPQGLAPFGVNIPIRNGKYRAVAPKVTLATSDVCGTATSVALPWPPSG